VSPGTTDLLFRVAATLAVLITAGSPVAIALLTHWRPKPGASATPPTPSPSVTDAAALQGMALALVEPLRTEVAEKTAELAVAERLLDARSRELLEERAKRQVAEAERDLYRGALTAADMPLPTLVHPSHREDTHG